MENDATDFNSIDLTNKYADEIDVSETKLANKSMQIQQLISHFEYRLLGFMWKNNAEKYYYTGHALMGDEGIQKVMLLLYPFSREVILISNKKDYTWQKQLLRTRLSMIDLLTKSIDVDVKDMKEIWRSFTNLLLNIGDVIVDKNAREFLEGYFRMDEPNPDLNLTPKGDQNGNI